MVKKGKEINAPFPSEVSAPSSSPYKRPSLESHPPESTLKK